MKNGSLPSNIGKDYHGIILQHTHNNDVVCFDGWVDEGENGCVRNFALY